MSEYAEYSNQYSNIFTLEYHVFHAVRIIGAMYSILGKCQLVFLCRETGNTWWNCPRALIPPPVGEPRDTSAPSTLHVVAPPTTTVATTESSLVGPIVLPTLPTAKPPYASAVRSGLLPDPPQLGVDPGLADVSTFHCSHVAY